MDKDKRVATTLYGWSANQGASTMKDRRRQNEETAQAEAEGGAKLGASARVREVPPMQTEEQKLVERDLAQMDALSVWMNEHEVEPEAVFATAAYHLGRMAESDQDFREWLARIHELINEFAHKGRRDEVKEAERLRSRSGCHHGGTTGGAVPEV
jgi:hypothetical protein